MAKKGAGMAHVGRDAAGSVQNERWDTFQKGVVDGTHSERGWWTGHIPKGGGGRDTFRKGMARDWTHTCPITSSTCPPDAWCKAIISASQEPIDLAASACTSSPIPEMMRSRSESSSSPIPFRIASGSTQMLDAASDPREFNFERWDSAPRVVKYSSTSVWPCPDEERWCVVCGRWKGEG